MEWVDFAMWLIVLLLALLVGRAATAMPALGVQVLTAAGGLLLCVLFIAKDGARGFAWGAVALGVVGILALTAGVAWLMDDSRPSSRLGVDVEEVVALLAGLELPLYGLAAVLAIPMALHVATLA
jgi:hypothetical protein